MGQGLSNLHPDDIPIWKPHLTAVTAEGKVPDVDIPPPESNKPYDDWSQTLKFTPQKVYKPTSSEEIRNILIKLPDSEKVSVIASAHSCSKLWINGTIITLTSMPKVFKDVSEEGEPAFSKVKVSANTTFRKCMQLLAKEGRTLPAMGGVDEQQLGGLLGTNTAPASKEFTIYADMEEIEYVTKDDTRKKATGEDLKALIGNLGLVGVVTYITIGTIPDYGMKAIQRIMPVKELVQLMVEGKNFKSGETEEDGKGEDEKEYEFWRFDCLPQLKSDVLENPGEALLWAARKIEDVSDPAKDHYKPDGDYVDSYDSTPLSMRIFCGVQKQSIQQYKLDPYNDPYTKTAFNVMDMLIDKTPGLNTFYGPQRNMLPVDRFMNKDVSCAMAEWAFLPKDAAKVMEIYQKYFHYHEWPNLPIEVEYVKCDDNYMSPWNSNKMKGGPVEYLVKFNTMWFFSDDCIAIDPQDGKQKIRSRKEQEVIRDQIEVHARGLWNQLKEENICFKAHWGKINFTTPEDVEQLYEWDKFKHYIQPQMMNKYYKKRLPKDHRCIRGGALNIF